MKEIGFKITTETSNIGTEFLDIKVITPNDTYMPYNKLNTNSHKKKL